MVRLGLLPMAGCILVWLLLLAWQHCCPQTVNNRNFICHSPSHSSRREFVGYCGSALLAVIAFVVVLSVVLGCGIGVPYVTCVVDGKALGRLVG